MRNNYNKAYFILLISIIYINSCSQEPVTPEEQFTISGTVTNSSTNLPIKGASVDFSDQRDTTDENGHYMLTDLRVGNFHYTIYHSDFDTLNGQILLDKNRVLHFQLEERIVVSFKDIELIIYDDFDSDPFFISDAELLISGGIYSSNDSGKIYIQNIEVDTHPVFITHPQYENYDSLIIVVDSVGVYNIILTPLFYDYFPFSMQQNSLFRYEQWFIHASGNGTIYRGTKEYHYRRSDVTGNNIIHRYIEFTNDTMITIELPDTTIVTSYNTILIDIVETEDHSLFANAPFFFKSISYYGFGRYIPISRGDSLYNWFYNPEIGDVQYLMEPEYGLIYYSAQGGTGMNPTFWYAWRTE